MDYRGERLSARFEADALAGPTATYIETVLEFDQWQQKIIFIFVQLERWADYATFVNESQLQEPPRLREREKKVPSYVPPTYRWLHFRLMRLQEILERLQAEQPLRRND
jgi:hypothetical protein